MHDDLKSVLNRLDEDRVGSVSRLCDFLRIPSISADPAHKGDVARAAEWVCGELRSAGLNASVRPAKGHPMVVAKHEGPAGYDGPRLLYYGHYDVQPPDPIELWKSGPFEPVVIDGARGKRIVARGAVDDKGQVMSFIEAFRAWIKVHGTLPCAVTVLLEGEEESGSESLEPFLLENREDLKADACIVSDTGMWDVETPAITTALRGLVYVEITVRGPDKDLHSGQYGGAVPNPINVLCSIIAQLHDSDRRVMLDGFYDQVEDVSPRVRQQWRDLGLCESEFMGSIGLKDSYGEKGFSALERTWSRPTCDVNGIFGGYTGKGAKTVIASHATAKVSFRLVASQDPHRVLHSIRAFFDTRLPAGCRMELTEFGANPAFLVPDGSVFLGAAERALAQVYERAPVLIGSGGSIPAVGAIHRILATPALLVGFGLDDDCVHSPNEKMEMACFEGAQRSHAAILHEIGRMRV
ncbi:MAG: dipeptidase [Phycisphaerales bacterium]|nr:dipeptidase [Phycisphaerales bacterium]